MRRALAWIGGAFGLAALVRWLRRPGPVPVPPPAPDPAAELRARLEEARAAGDDRDEFDAAEGQPLEEAEPPPRSIEERRRAIHEQAQEALGEMQRPPGE